MPTPEAMTWVARTRTWTRMHKGRRYWVSARQLGVASQTKEASVKAANAWWAGKQAELDAAGFTAARPLRAGDDVVAAMIGSPTWDSLLAVADAAVRHLGQLPPSPGAEYLAEQVEDAAAHEDDYGPEVWESIGGHLREKLLMELLRRTVIHGEPVPEQLAERLPRARSAQLAAAVTAIRGESAGVPEQSVGAQASAWLAVQAARVAGGQMSAARCDNNRHALAHYRAYLGDGADVATIDAGRLQGFYLHCLGRMSARRADPADGWSAAFARDVFGTAKLFTRWLWEQGAIELPKNIGSRAFEFGSSARKIETWTAAEFRAAVEQAPGTLKLALLLMANCGMTQQDVSDLRDEEVDWAGGYITRRRSKTAQYENVPTVRYKLWPVTMKLLTEHRSGTERVLLTESGRPYVRTELVNGKLRKADGFQSNFARLKRRLGLARSLKQLRKLGATLLDGHAKYGRFGSYFLAHSPRTVKDKHYAQPSQALFDQAVVWLGRQLEIV